jgi:hypothetical protein
MNRNLSLTIQTLCEAINYKRDRHAVDFKPNRKAVDAAGAHEKMIRDPSTAL